MTGFCISAAAGDPCSQHPRTRLVVLAHRYDSKRIATFDERAFRNIPPFGGGSFRLLPADAV